MARIRAAVRAMWAAGVERFRRRGRASLWHLARLTSAAVASYVVAALAFPSTKPLLAPLTALLVVQLTPVSILRSGIQRVVSVVAGVAVAVALSSLVEISWWSLAATIAVSLAIGQLLRLGDNLLEVPISAMLVLGVGSRTAESAAWKRIAETLIGAGVGVAVNLLFPPKVTTRDAADAEERLAADLARLLDSAAEVLADESVSTGDLEQRAWDWVGAARRLTHDIPNVGTSLLRAEESRRLNLRALTLADSGPGLRLGLESLEHSATAVRGMLRSVVQATHDYRVQGRDLSRQMRLAIADLLSQLAAALASYGALLRAESSQGEVSGQQARTQADLSRLRETRDRLLEVLLVDPRSDGALGLLTSSVLSTIERILQELSLEDRQQRQVRRPPTLTPPRIPRPRQRGEPPAPSQQDGPT